MTILDRLKDRLADCRGRWPDVSAASGVPVSTVRKIAQGVSKDPGVRTVQRLVDYFNGQPPHHVDQIGEKRTAAMLTPAKCTEPCADCPNVESCEERRERERRALEKRIQISRRAEDL